MIYDDFLHKVAAGRKLPFEQVQAVAKGRVWTGADAKTQGLVDGLGGFWTAAGLAAGLGGVPAGPDRDQDLSPATGPAGEAWATSWAAAKPA